MQSYRASHYHYEPKCKFRIIVKTYKQRSLWKEYPFNTLNVLPNTFKEDLETYCFSLDAQIWTEVVFIPNEVPNLTRPHLEFT